MFFAIFTVVTSLIIFEIQREEVVISGFLITTLSSLFLIFIGVMMFEEKINVMQFLGIAIVMIGMFFITQYQEEENKESKEE
jgi:drug/metabolite transporter (DMT)-like permease